MNDSETYAVIGAAIEVHRELGQGFAEGIYQESMETEFSRRQIPFTPQFEIPVHYKGKRLKTLYRADFVTHESIIVEIKATSALTENDFAQILNYLKATGFQKGLLINFGAKSLEHRRLIHSADAFSSSLKKKSA